MKSFITFIAILSVAVSIVIYDTDMGAYMQKQEKIKALAEDAAAGAALYYDEYSYGQGYMVFNRKEGIKFIDGILKGKFPEDEISYDLEYFEGIRKPAVEVTLKVKGKDMFRLPFLKVENIVRKAKYELPET